MKRTLSLSTVLLAIFIFGNRIDCSKSNSATSGFKPSILSPPTSEEVTLEDLYKYILDDTCGSTNITNIEALASSTFASTIDEKDLGRTPLHMAIYNQSLNCVRYILKRATTGLDFEEREVKEQILLEASDKRGWRAIEYALKYFPYVGSKVLPSADSIEKIKLRNIMKLAMRSGPFKTNSFLLNLTTRRDIMSKTQGKITTFKRIIMVLDELMEVLEPNSKFTNMFLENYLKDLKFKERMINKRDDLEAEALKNFFIRSIEKNCSTIYTNRELIACLTKDEIEALIEAAINNENALATRDILEAWDEKKKDVVLDILKRKCFLQSARIHLNFYQELTLAFHYELLSGASPFDLNITSKTFDQLNIDERASYISSIPTFIHDNIPTVLLLAFKDPEMIGKLLQFKEAETLNKLFNTSIHESFFINSLGELVETTMVDFITCYVPECLSKRAVKNYQPSLSFTISASCKSHPYTKATAIKILLCSDDDKLIQFALDNIQMEWEVLHELLYGANLVQLLEVIRKAIEVRNFNAMLGAAELRDKPLPFTIFDSLLACGNVERNYLIELMEYGFEEPISAEQAQNIERALVMPQNPNPELSITSTTCSSN